MMMISVMLLISSLLSQCFMVHKQTLEDNTKFMFGDVFVLTTIDKLLCIGFNIHLVIFFISRK